MIKKKALTLFLLASISSQALTWQKPLALQNESPLFNFKNYNFQTEEITYDETKPVYLYKDGPQVTIPNEFVNPKEQFRTAWLSTVFNIDVNTVTRDPNLSAEEEFKIQFTSYLDKFEELNFNAVTFQVSPMLDAWYKSDIAPWSQYLHEGGRSYTFQGKDPGFNGFDPLEWMVSEAHKRGMEFHAWFNPYRVTNDVDTRPVAEKLNDLAENNFARLHPELVYEFQNKLFLDPGKPEVIDYVVARVNEVATKYNVDAIHFDDYFYPYKYTKNGKPVIFAEQGIDKETFLAYNRGFGEYNLENAAKWRENNINLLIGAIKNEIDTINVATGKSIQFGVSPFGIWGHAEEYPEGSNTPTGSTSSLRDQFANTRKWVKDGLVDYLTPQIYWAFNTGAAPYGELLKWWDAQFEGVTNSHLYIGHPNYKYIEADWDSNFENPYEIANQLRFNQKFKNVKGSGFFSYSDLLPKTVSKAGDRSDVLNHANAILKKDYFNLPSNVPGKPWLDKVATVPISNAKYEINENQIKISWDDTNTDSKFYCVYRQESNLDTVDINNPANLISRFGIEAGKEFVDKNVDTNKTYTYAVTVIDNASVENEAKIFNKEILDNETAALPVIEAINKIPSLDALTLDDEPLVTSARTLVTAFNNDSYVTNLDVLIAAENKIAELKAEKAREEQIAKENVAISAIDKLPSLENITLNDEEAIKAARELVTIANNDSAITNLDKLVKAEAKIKELKDNNNTKPEEENKNVENENNGGKLPKTGGRNSSILLSIASILTIAGTTLFKKK